MIYQGRICLSVECDSHWRYLPVLPVLCFWAQGRTGLSVLGKGGATPLIWPVDYEQCHFSRALDFQCEISCVLSLPFPRLPPLSQ